MTAQSGKGEVVSVLLALEQEKATGVLDFRAEDVLTRVFVEDGVPVFAEAGSHGETLGNVLVREQVITQAQFAAVVRRMTDALVDDENVRFGEVVVELGILSQEDLERALTAQVEKKIIGCVQRGEGEWSFEAKSLGEVPRRKAPVRSLLLDAAANFPAERAAAIASPETFPRVSVPPATIAENFGVEPAELEALRKLDGTRALKDVMAEAPNVDAGALVSALKLGGAVELLDKPADPPPETETATVSATGRRRAFANAKAIQRDKAKASIERFIREREAPLPKARNEREATLFAEDEFQSGRRLLAQGKLDEARAKLERAASLAPKIDLYRLYADFAESRGPSGFEDLAHTKKLAIQMVRGDAEQPFAYYVLGYLALSEHDTSAAKKFFKQAFKLDPELVDAGRQVRLLELRPAETPVAAKSNRTMILAAALALIVIVAIASFVLLKK